MKDEFKIEKEGVYKGYRYKVLALSIGHRCGYVLIPKGHYLYEKGYSDDLNITLDDLKDKKIGKRGVLSLFITALKKDKNKCVSMDMLFDVHGSITFARRIDDEWWIGFDCAHIGDAKDPSIMDPDLLKVYKEIGQDLDKKYKKLSQRSGGLKVPFFTDGSIKDTNYVEKECKRLINQIIKYYGR